MDQLLNSDLYSYRNFVRLSPELFRELLERLGPVIQKQKTRFRQPLPAGLKIGITLRYLVMGDSYKSLMYCFKVAFNTISLFVPEVRQSTRFTRMMSSSVPSTPQEWRNGECVWYTGQSLQMPTVHNGPGATQCQISGFGLCDWADHQGLADEEDNNHSQVPGGKVKFCQTLGNHSSGTSHNCS